MEQLAPLFFHQIVPYDDIGVTRFILQGDEHHAFRRAWTLTAGDDAGGARGLAMKEFSQLFGSGKMHAPQPLPQQGERMPAKREPEARIIRDEVLAFLSSGK